MKKMYLIVLLVILSLSVQSQTVQKCEINVFKESIKNDFNLNNTNEVIVKNEIIQENKPLKSKEIIIIQNYENINLYNVKNNIQNNMFIIKWTNVTNVWIY